MCYMGKPWWLPNLLAFSSAIWSFSLPTNSADTTSIREKRFSFGGMAAAAAISTALDEAKKYFDPEIIKASFNDPMMIDTALSSEVFEAVFESPQLKAVLTPDVIRTIASSQMMAKLMSPATVSNILSINRLANLFSPANLKALLASDGSSSSGTIPPEFINAVMGSTLVKNLLNPESIGVILNAPIIANLFNQNNLINILGSPGVKERILNVDLLNTILGSSVFKSITNPGNLKVLLSSEPLVSMLSESSVKAVLNSPAVVNIFRPVDYSYKDLLDTPVMTHLLSPSMIITILQSSFGRAYLNRGNVQALVTSMFESIMNSEIAASVISIMVKTELPYLHVLATPDTIKKVWHSPVVRKLLETLQSSPHVKKMLSSESLKALLNNEDVVTPKNIQSTLSNPAVKEFLSLEYLEVIANSKAVSTLYSNDVALVVFNSETIARLGEPEYLRTLLDSKAVKHVLQTEFVKIFLDSKLAKNAFSKHAFHTYVDAPSLQSFLTSAHIAEILNHDQLDKFTSPENMKYLQTSRMGARFFDGDGFNKIMESKVMHNIIVSVEAMGPLLLKSLGKKLTRLGNLEGNTGGHVLHDLKDLVI